MSQTLLDTAKVKQWRRYNSFERTRVLWIDQHPDGWIGAPLKRWVETKITDGPHETPELVAEGIDFVSAESMKDGKIDFNYRRGYITQELHSLYCRKCHPRRNDIFMCKSGATTGKLAIVETDREFSVWSPLAQIRVDIEKGAPRYMYWALHSDYVQNQIRRTWTEGTQPNISMASIERLFVVGPALVSEQRAIAAFLDRETARIDALIGYKERLIALLEEKRQAVINHAVTRGLDPQVKLTDSGLPWMESVPTHWQVLPLKRIATRVEVGIAAAATHAYRDLGVPIIRSTNVRRNYLDTDDMYFIDPEFAEQNRSKYLRSGDLVTTRTGANLGMTAVVPEEYDMSQCFTLLMATLRKPHDSAYFCYWMNSRGNQFHFEVEGWGAGQHNLSVPVIQLMPVPIPPPAEQVEIVAYIHRATSLIQSANARIREGISRLHEYRTALISAAVTGQIDVREEVNLND